MDFPPLIYGCLKKKKVHKKSEKSGCKMFKTGVKCSLDLAKKKDRKRKGVWSLWKVTVIC